MSEFDWSRYGHLVEMGKRRERLTDLHHALKYEERAIAASDLAEADGTIEAHEEAVRLHQIAANLHGRCENDEKAKHHHARREHHTARLTEMHAKRKK